MTKPPVVLLICQLACAMPAGASPTSDPAADFKLPWTSGIKWSQVVDVTTMPGADNDAKLGAAQQELASRGGGVVFFPPGEYRFRESILLLDGIVLRGAPPEETDARKESYQLTSRIEFPKYQFSAEGGGTPITTVFKSIELADPATASNCGVVHLAINRGHIHFKQAEDGTCGRNRIIHGCILRNAAFADPGIPDSSLGQKRWQRYTWRFGAAIEAKSEENLLISNNRLPKSGEDDFTMNGFIVRDRRTGPVAIDGVVFDYDNRPGIYANHESLGGNGGQGPDGTPETHPLGFRKGIVIRNNLVYSTGRCAIGFSGDGTVCADNVIRFPRDVWRPTATGRELTGGSSTNDNRAIEVRGWRWSVTGNDYIVHRNWSYERKHPINDGEGIMHEDHANSTIRDSVLSHNRGNTYLSMYKTAGIDGLLVEGNDIRLGDGRQTIAGGAAIFVSANRTDDAFPCRNVRIIGNTVSVGGISLIGIPAGGNVIRGNRTVGTAATEGGYLIENRAGAEVADNTGFDRVDDAPWIGHKAAKEAARAKREQTKTR